MDSSQRNEIFCPIPELDGLRNFILPRRKKCMCNVYLEICHTDRREHSFIQTALNTSKLDSSYNLNYFWKFGDVKLIHNETLEQQFAEKRSKMREDGRCTKELEEHTMFLVTSQSSALNIYQEGLKVGSSSMKALGDPRQGVYLSRYIDVILKQHRFRNQIADTILFFKVLLGKVMAVPPFITRNRNAVVDPTAKFDCHTSQSSADLKDPIDIQIINSAVYLYEFNSSCEIMETPRQCLPYALVTVQLAGNEAKDAAFPSWLSSAATRTLMPPAIGAGNLKNCTQAQRLGKGKNAEVVYQHFGMAESPPVSPAQCSPGNNFGSLVESKIKSSHDPRLLERQAPDESGRGRSVSNQASLPGESIPVDPTLKAIQIVNVRSLTLAQYLMKSEPGCHGPAGGLEEQTQSRFPEAQAIKCEEFDPFGVSTPTAAASSTQFFGPAVVSQGAAQREDHVASPVRQRDPDSNLGSGTPTEGLPRDPSGGRISDEPYFEDLKLYESELRKKLRKYSRFLALPEKERIAKVESMRDLNRRNKMILIYRLKKYDKHFEKYQSKLGLHQCHDVAVSNPCAAVCPCDSEGSARQDVKPSLSTLTCESSVLNSGDAVSYNLSAFRDTATQQQPKQRETPLVQGEGMSDVSESDIPPRPSAVKSGLPEMLASDGVREPSGKETPSGGFEAKRENSPETDREEDKMNQVQSSWDDVGTNPTEGTSLLIEFHLQPASPPVTSDAHPGNPSEPADLCFPAVNYFSGGQVGKTDTPHLGELIPSVESHSGGSREDKVQNGERQKSTGARPAEGDVIYVCGSEEVEAPALCSKSAAHTRGESQSRDTLRHILAARIEWPQFLNKSKISKLKAEAWQNPSPIETAAKPRIGSDSPPSGEGQGDPRDEILLAPNNRTVVPYLQLTLSNDLSSEYDCYLEQPTAVMSGIAAERGGGQLPGDASAFMETEADKCLEISNEEHGVALDGGTVKAISKTDNPALKDALLTDNLILPKLVRNSKERDACGSMTSECDLDRMLNNDLSYYIDQARFKDCGQNSIYSLGLHVVGPRNNLPEISQENNAPRSPNDESCRMAVKDVQHLAAGHLRCDVKNIEPDSDGESLAKDSLSEEILGHVNEWCDSVTEVAHKEDRENDTVLSDASSGEPNERLCCTVQGEKMKDFSTAPRPQVEDAKCLKQDSMEERNVLKEESNIASAYDVFSTLEGVDNKPDIDDVIATGNRETICKDMSTFHHSVEHNSEPKCAWNTASENMFSFKSTEQTNSVRKEVGQVSVEPKKTLCPTGKFKSPGKYRHQNSRALNLVHSGSLSTNLPHVAIHSTRHIKKKLLGSKQSTDDFISLCEGRRRSFNTSKEQIRQVTGVLLAEALLSRSRRLSKLLTKAATQLKKAHRRLCESSEIVSKASLVRDQGSLPKSYQDNGNSFWESCEVNSGLFLKGRRSVFNPECRPVYRQSDEPKQGEGLVVSPKKGKPLLKGTQTAGFRSKNDPRATKGNGVSGKTAGGELTTEANRSAMSANPAELGLTAEHQINHPKFKTQGIGGQTVCLSPGLDQGCKSSEEATFSNYAFNQSESSLLTCLTKPTLVESQVELRPTESETTSPRVASATLNFPSESRFVEPQTGTQMNPREDKSCVGKRTDAEANTSGLKEMRFPVETGPSKSRWEVNPANEPVEFKMLQGNNDHTDLESVDFPNAGLPFTWRTAELLTDSLTKSDVVKDDVGPWPARSQTAKGGMSLQDKTQDIQSQFGLNATGFPVGKSQVESRRTEDNTASSVAPQAEEVLVKSRETQPASERHGKDSGIEPGCVLSSQKPFPKKSGEPELRSESMAQEGEIMSDSETESAYVRDAKTFAERKTDQRNLKPRGDSETTGGQKPPPILVQEAQLREYLVVQMSEILREADTTPLLDKLEELKLTCEQMLPTFVSAFERSQGEPFPDVIVSRDLLLRNHLRNPTRLVHLKSGALESFVELQIMTETVQFLENRINVLKGLPTFRSLLWYDETLYNELLVGKEGSQQQSSFYPSFQERVRSKSVNTVHDYRAQVLKTFRMEMKGQNAYYVYLKHRRELEESSAIVRNKADWCRFCLSMPLTTSINFGDNVETLEALRKDVWMLMHKCSSFPEDQCDVGKLVHLWIIIDMVNAKMRTIHSCCLPAEDQLAWFGMEHIRFNAAKMMAWQKKRKRFEGSNSRAIELRSVDQRNKWKELMAELNTDAKLVLYKTRHPSATISVSHASQKDASGGDNFLDANDSVKLPNGDLTEQNAPESQSFEGCLDPEPRPFTSVGIILERSQAARREELEQLLQVCERQFESLKRCFQGLQRVDVEKVLVTESGVLDPCASPRNVIPVLLNLEAVEIYIELIMVYETIHYLKNLLAQQSNHPTYRGMLWFVSALFPELLQSQRDISVFSFFHQQCLNNPRVALEEAISSLQAKLDAILEYRQSTNYTYAFLLLSRECSELKAVRMYMRRHKLYDRVYMNAAPYAVSINYGCTDSELNHNYRQFGTALERLDEAPLRDVGKMTHIMEVMKSIMVMKQVVAEDRASAMHLLTYQLQLNSNKRQTWAKAENPGGRSRAIQNAIDCEEKDLPGLPSDTTHVASPTAKGTSLQLCNTRKRQFCEVALRQPQRRLEVDEPPMSKRRMLHIPVEFIGFETSSSLASHSFIKPSFQTQKKSRWDCCQ